MLAAEIQQGQRVRILGRFNKRRVTVYVTQTPVDAGKGSVLVMGYSARNGKHGTSSAHVIRIVDAAEVVELVEP